MQVTGVSGVRAVMGRVSVGLGATGDVQGRRCVHKTHKWGGGQVQCRV